MQADRLIISYLFLILIGMSSCLSVPEQHHGPAPGTWRAVLNLDGIRRSLNTDAKPKPSAQLQFEAVTDGELPFILDIAYINDEELAVTIYNGEEEIAVEEVTFGRDRRTGMDSIVMAFPHYNSYIHAYFEEDVIEGKYIVETKENYSIPFLARHGLSHRFSTLRKEPALDLSGRWETTFGIEGDAPYKAIAEFKQDGNHLTGTFLTETGDYRFLEGTVQANKFYLSTFDGAHAFLVEGKIMEDGRLLGAFRSGSHYETTFESVKNPDFQLTDPEKLTYLKEGYEAITFSFPDVTDELVSLTDDAFQGKYKIIQILGTWCPNCADETAFLTTYLKENSREDLAVIGLAFEPHKEKAKAMQAIRQFKQRFDVKYPVLWAGSSDKNEAAEALPMLNAIVSYPTMIFLDKNNQVIKIHTGFSGPATSTYDTFRKDFATFIQNLP